VADTVYLALRNSRWEVDEVKSTIYKLLEGIPTKLKGEGFVHGDFRANNIMVKPGEE
jgi:aminoglycoside phosphotransferase (APT) family kinase protein